MSFFLSYVYYTAATAFPPNKIITKAYANCLTLQVVSAVGQK